MEVSALLDQKFLEGLHYDLYGLFYPKGQIISLHTWKINLSYFQSIFITLNCYLFHYPFWDPEVPTGQYGGRTVEKPVAALLLGGVRFMGSPGCCHAAICLEDHWHMTKRIRGCNDWLLEIVTPSFDEYENTTSLQKVFEIKMHLIYKSFLRYFIID